jgi:hypothetical protein
MEPDTKARKATSLQLVAFYERESRSLRGGWRTEPNAVAKCLRYWDNDIARLGQGDFMRWREQSRGQGDCRPQRGEQRLPRLESAPAQFRTRHCGAITERMLDARILRNTQNGEKWVVKQKRNKQQANRHSAAGFRRPNQHHRISRHCTHTTTIVKTPHSRQGDAGIMMFAMRRCIARKARS